MTKSSLSDITKLRNCYHVLNNELLLPKPFDRIETVSSKFMSHSFFGKIYFTYFSGSAELSESSQISVTAPVVERNRKSYTSSK